jgi:hypothetical protein
MGAVIARTLSMISSAVAVHLMGLQSLFPCVTNDSISRSRAFTDLVELGNSMQRLDLRSLRAAWAWMIVGCCCCRSCTGSCVVCSV